jgi:hypothetical protein
LSSYSDEHLERYRTLKKTNNYNAKFELIDKFRGAVLGGAFKRPSLRLNLKCKRIYIKKRRIIIKGE